MGHAAGDQLLIETARRLVQAVRDSDTVARLGGDEFAVILPMIGGRAEVEEVARRVVAALAQPFALSGGEARISASVGVAIYPEHGADLEHIRANADAALYAVKAAGRNERRSGTAVRMWPDAKYFDSLAIPQGVWLLGLAWFALLALFYALYGAWLCLRGRPQDAHHRLGVSSLEDEIRASGAREESRP